MEKSSACLKVAPKAKTFFLSSWAFCAKCLFAATYGNRFNIDPFCPSVIIRLSCQAWQAWWAWGLLKDTESEGFGIVSPLPRCSSGKTARLATPHGNARPNLLDQESRERGRLARPSRGRMVDYQCLQQRQCLQQAKPRRFARSASRRLFAALTTARSRVFAYQEAVFDGSPAINFFRSCAITGFQPMRLKMARKNC